MSKKRDRSVQGFHLRSLNNHSVHKLRSDYTYRFCWTWTVRKKELQEDGKIPIEIFCQKEPVAKEPVY